VDDWLAVSLKIPLQRFLGLGIETLFWGLRGESDDALQILFTTVCLVAT
jgi:hypothetical protein